MSRPARVPQAEIERVRLALSKLESDWPKGLWLFAGNGNLYLMLGNEDGTHETGFGGSVDSSRILAEFAIDNDGGGW